MLYLFYFFFFCMFLSLMFLFLGKFFCKKTIFDEMKKSPFECGFSPKFKSRVPFSLRFYLVSVIFLIFDVELVLIFPIIINCSNFINNSMAISIFLFFMMLTMGLFYELNSGSMNWVK